MSDKYGNIPIEHMTQWDVDFTRNKIENKMFGDEITTITKSINKHIEQAESEVKKENPRLSYGAYSEKMAEKIKGDGVNISYEENIYDERDKHEMAKDSIARRRNVLGKAIQVIDVPIGSKDPYVNQS